MDRSTPNLRCVTKAWTASYNPALSVAQGEALTSHHTDPDNPGWRWNTNDAGLGGWLPEGLVVDGKATAAFNSRELTIAAGEEVETRNRCNGWSLCRTKDGRIGWLPDSHLTD